MPYWLKVEVGFNICGKHAPEGLGRGKHALGAWLG